MGRPVPGHRERFDIDDASSSCMSYEDFKDFLSQSDNTIGLVPLDDSRFSRCKSGQVSGLCERGNSNHLLRCGAVLGGGKRSGDGGFVSK